MLKKGIIPSTPPVRFQILLGTLKHKEKGVQTEEISEMYNKSRYKFFLDSPFEISAMCCKVMKKSPMHTYQNTTGRKPMTAQMASESRLRTQQFFEHLHLKRIVIDKDIPFPMSTFERMLRYAKYGYFPCKETKMKIINALRDLTDEQVELSESLYDGMD